MIHGIIVCNHVGCFCNDQNKNAAEDMRSQVCQYSGCSIQFLESEDKALALRKMSLHPPVRLLKARGSRWLCSSKQTGDIPCCRQVALLSVAPTDSSMSECILQRARQSHVKPTALNDAPNPISLRHLTKPRSQT